MAEKAHITQATKQYILTFDLGTSSERVICFDKNFSMLAMEQEEFKQYYPAPDRVEQEPQDLVDVLMNVTEKLCRKNSFSPEQIAAIGITNQRETTIVWNRHTGEPIYRAIVWQDKRTGDRCNALKDQGIDRIIRKKTGLKTDAYFSATKIEWILNHVEGARDLAEKGDLLFGTVETWIIWKLSDGKYHVSDYSNASRTMLYNISDLCWDEELLSIFNIPLSMMPTVTDSSGMLAEINCSHFGQEGTLPICGIAGDQQAALFGQNCIESGQAKNTYGTGCFMLMNTGDQRVYSEHGLLTTIAWGLNGKISYALEGSIFIAGAVIKWLRDELHLIKSASETENIANSLKDTNGVYVVPAFSGLGAPHWDQSARGAILGLTQGVTDKHIIRAALESLAYQTKDVLNAMEEDSRVQLDILNVDGGATANNFLMQFQADILNCPVCRPDNVESTALGAALLAGLGIGLWTMDDILKNRRLDRKFEPNMDESQRDTLYHGWIDAVNAVKK